MGKLNTIYGQLCYDSGTVINRDVTKYLRNCVAQNGSPCACGSTDAGGAALELGRIICRRSGCRMIERRSNSKTISRRSEQERGKVTAYDSADEDEFEEHVELVDESRLAYRAEGNANIVLSLVDSYRVLRLRKSTVACRDGKDSNIDLQRFIKYSRVVASLFSCQYVPKPKLGRLDTYDLEAFNQTLIKFRPVTRLDKDIRERDGILYPDVAFLPSKLDSALFLQQDFRPDTRVLSYNTYCVEIKPKQGWSFHDEHFEDGFVRQKLFSNCDNTIAELTGSSLGKCRYCLHQYLKLQKKSIAKVSKYCPLDLFSGKSIRMLHAIKGLIGAPQNNLRVLKNGRIVYDEKQEKFVFNRILKEIFQRDGRTKEERKTIFMNLIKEILLKDFSCYEEHCDRKLLTIRKDRKKKDKNLLHQRTCNPINYQFLPANCALKQILNVQLLVKSSLANIGRHKLRQGSGDSFEYVDELYEKYLDCLEHCSSREDVGKCESKQTILTEKLKNVYLNEEEKYQLGATALDCSIMLTFRRLTDQEEDRLPPHARTHIISIENMKFLTKITITDLDPKSLKHHKKYFELLRDSIGAYREFMSKIRH
ncbi:inositol-pentakisphosphate 2-kinase [Malaya genurostris]|uniref:inositol-pentakisphosphate 2-kinase n=1 Tax=Malaya genurostris TaxID=325434 RepID=UPI0026F3A8F3|nr:inositol-pentakisphosphate 2-kinase [Malaya genurostris]XP_058448021.1 inositol-pentakisphosphate 2-kinase [Malaya genurostris]XP_058448022.1 inositol-pentakisphosphate 2-kinase [Malaya genurostris]